MNAHARNPGRQPFVVVPWEHDFLQALADTLIRNHAPDLDQVLLIFPHARPARYLRRILAARPDLPKPCLLPTMLSLPLFLSNMAAEADEDRGRGNHKEHGPLRFPLPRTPSPSLTRIGGDGVWDGSGMQEGNDEGNGGTLGMHFPRQTAHVLDQVAVLRETALQVAATTGHAALAAVAADARRWLPWGTRLAALMEDIFTAGITPGNFDYLEGSVPPFAAALLENLAAIHRTYIAELDRRQLTTSGYDARLVLETIRAGGKSGGANWRAIRGRQIILAGFYGLSGVEDGLFKDLWLNHGAQIFLHSDARILSEPTAAHWSCAGHAAWIKNWNAAAQLADIPADRPTPSEPDLAFYQGYDLHSQLTRLHDLLAERADSQSAPDIADATDAYESAAVALLDSGLLMPLLHHLPGKNVNISMGYPLERSPLARLAELILAVQESPGGHAEPREASIFNSSPDQGEAQTERHEDESFAPLRYSQDDKPSHAQASPLHVHAPLRPVSPPFPKPDQSGFRRGEGPGEGNAFYRIPLTPPSWRGFEDRCAKSGVFACSPAGQLPSCEPSTLSPTPQSGFRREGVRGREPQGAQLLGVPSPGVSVPDPHPYHWRAVVNLLRHPYLRMLTRDGERPFQAALALLEKEARQGARFVDPRELAASPAYERALTLAGLDPGPVMERVARLLEVTVTAWEGVFSLGGVADNLSRLADFLLEEGRDLWPRFPLDGEYLFRLSEHLAPQLKQSAFADEELDRPALFDLLREAVRGERVPFEAEPLEGMQILGMLETRLLSFERVYVLDATDDRLPGAPAHDPLLPDALRRELGLPGLAQRELAMAYTFNRLLRSAREVAVFYQTGAGSGGLMDEKKVRSRFVEELIWKEEKRRGKLLTPGEAPLHNIAFQITPAASAERAAPKTEAASRALEAWLRKPVSPTALDAYLRCPLQFFYARLAGLTPPDAVREGDDPAGIGEFTHAVLQDFFAAYQNTPLADGFPAPQDEARLADTYFARLKADPALTALPYASYLMLETTGFERLRNMLRQTPPRARILALETALAAPLDVDGRRIMLHGKIDRVDLRNGGGNESAPSLTSHSRESGNPGFERKAAAAPGMVESMTHAEKIAGTRAGATKISASSPGFPAAQSPASILDSRFRGNDLHITPQGHIMILDYKSGRVREGGKAEFWTPRNPLWRAMEEWTPDTPNTSGAPGSDPLALLADGLKTLQLPVYMYLYQHHAPDAAVHAAFVDIARSGAEKPLFPEGLLKDEDGGGDPAAALRRLYAAYIPSLPRFVLRHMLGCREFTPRPGGHCAWCEYRALCRRRI